MKMKKFIYILPLLVVLFFQKENIKSNFSQDKPKLKVTDTVKKKDSIAKPVEKLEMYHESAHASYYANKFNGRRTASGTRFNNNC